MEGEADFTLEEVVENLGLRPLVEPLLAQKAMADAGVAPSPDAPAGDGR